MANENNLCTGLITVAPASATVVGNASNFNPEVYVNGWIKFIDNGGTYRALQVKSVESDTSLTLWAVAPTGSTATAVVFYSGNVLDTYLQPGATGTGTISTEAFSAAIVGAGTNFDPQTPAGTVLTYGSGADVEVRTVDVVTNDTNLTVTVASDLEIIATAFVFATAAQAAVMFGEFSGENGIKYLLKNDDMTVFSPAGAVAAAVALGWKLVASPAAPSPPATPPGDQTMLPPTNDSTAYDVIGQDGISYHLQPWDDAGTWNLYVPSMAVNAALEEGWTI